MKKPCILTVGHSTRSIDEFVELLRAHGVKGIVDIRSIPRSRHNPQFNTDVLEHSLLQEHMSYKHIKELGGLRRARKDSLNLGWQNVSFRGFADYMATPEFSEDWKRLLKSQGPIKLPLCVLRRGGAVALPSITYRGRIDKERMGSAGYYEPCRCQETSTDAVSKDKERAAYIS